MFDTIYFVIQFRPHIITKSVIDIHLVFILITIISYQKSLQMHLCALNLSIVVEVSLDFGPPKCDMSSWAVD